MLGTTPLAISNPISRQVALFKNRIDINKGVNGTGIVGQCNEVIYPHEVQCLNKYLILTGLNDMHTWNGSAAGKAGYETALKAALAWLSIPFYKKFKAQQFAFSGRWTATPTYGGLIGKYTTANGATATIVVRGTTILIATTMLNTGGGSFTVTIDGSPVAGISCSGGALDVQSLVYCPQLTIYSGLSDTDHTVVLTAVISSTTAYLDWVAGFSTVAAEFPRVFVGNCLKMTATGYASQGGSDSDVAYWNDTLIPNAVNALTALGLPITLINVATAYTPDGTNTQADGYHPTQAGHNQIAGALISGIGVL